MRTQKNKLLDYINARLRAKGMTEKAMVIRSGITNYRALKAGTVTPHDAPLERIARVIGVDPLYLIRLKGIHPLSVERRPEKTMICGHCGKPGKGYRGARYAHKTCAQEVSKIRVSEDLKKIKTDIVDFRDIRHQKAARTCLCCNRNFKSEGPWNRICPRCDAKNRRSDRAAQREACRVSVARGHWGQER